MQVKCPACSASFSLEVAFAIEAGRSALLKALHMPAPLAELLAGYLGMFRPSGRTLALDKANRLMAELLPMLTSQTVDVGGSSSAATHAIWQRGLERMVALRNSNKLELPLQSHDDLLRIVADLAASGAAGPERQMEIGRQPVKSTPQHAGQLERIRLISQIRGDVELQILTPEEGAERLRAAGINPEVLNGLARR